jgi:folate-binding protein YgfZ
MPTAQLGDRAAILIDGPDAEHFLQNILTVDLDQLGGGEARPGALLSPQGKILFDFLVSRHGQGGFLIDCRADSTTDFMRRLMLYRLRAKADISVADQIVVSARWHDDSAASDDDSTPSQAESGWLADRRFPEGAGVFRSYGEAAGFDSPPEHFARLRIANGVAESGEDFAPGDAFPHDVLMDENGGVGFHKGCYIGQEVVSRMQHRGTARRRIMIVTGADDLPASGTDVLAGSRTIGALGSVSGHNGLAIVRTDRVKEAQDGGAAITAGGIELSLSIPPAAKYTLPQTAPQTSGTEENQSRS